MPGSYQENKIHGCRRPVVHIRGDFLPGSSSPNPAKVLEPLVERPRRGLKRSDSSPQTSGSTVNPDLRVFAEELPLKARSCKGRSSCARGVPACYAHTI